MLPLMAAAQDTKTITGVVIDENNLNGSLGYNLVFSRASDSYAMRGIKGHRIASGSMISISSFEENVKVLSIVYIVGVIIGIIVDLIV